MTKMGWTGLCAVMILTATVCASAPARAEAPPGAPEDTSRRGGWLELKYSLSFGYGGAGGPRLLGGYRWGRVMLGLELGASHSQQEGSVMGGAQTTFHWTNVLARPVLEVAFLQRRSWELFAQGGAGVLFSLSRMESGGQYRSEALGLVVHLAGGARVFVHPRLAIGVELGVAGSFYRGEDRSPGSEAWVNRSWSAQLYGALGVAVRL